MGLWIWLGNEQVSFSQRNRPGCVSRVLLDTSTQAEKCPYDISCLLIPVLLAVLLDALFLKEDWEGNKDHCCLQTTGRGLHPGTSQIGLGQFGSCQAPTEEEPVARSCCAARAELLRSLLVPRGLAAGIQAWAART